MNNTKRFKTMINGQSNYNNTTSNSSSINNNQSPWIWLCNDFQTGKCTPFRNEGKHTKLPNNYIGAPN
jgi:hypothetical protein